MKSILILIPTFNEEMNICQLIDKIQKVMLKYTFSILVIDDNSIDKTRFLIKQKQLIYSNLFLLERKDKLGLASAYVDGFNYALKNNFEYAIQMDADFSHNPEYLPLIAQKLDKYDVVVASRNIKGGRVLGWSLIRNLISKGGSIYSKIVLGCPINDLTGGFNGWNCSVVKKILSDEIISKGYCFQIEMKYRAFKNNAKIHEFPIIFQDRKYGKSKMNSKIFFEAFINIIKLKYKF